MISTVLAVFGVIVGVLAVIYAVIAVRRRRVMRNETVFPLIVNSPPFAIKVTFEDQQVEHPYAVLVELTSIGRRDVDPDAFHGEPLRVHVGARVISATLTILGSGEVRRDLLQPDHPQDVFLPPGLLHRGEPWLVSLLCDGTPADTITYGSLTDTDWVRGDAVVPSWVLVVMGLIPILTASGGLVLFTHTSWHRLAVTVMVVSAIAFAIVATGTAIALMLTRTLKRILRTTGFSGD